MSKSSAENLEPEKEKRTTLKNKKVTKVDVSKYEGAGQSFKAKLIGFEDVSGPKGEKMCQVAIAKLKAGVVAMGEHKEKIVLNLTTEGISIYDEKKEVLLHRHTLKVVSYVARDVNDSRSFAYVINDEDGKHRCVGIKTEKSADLPVAGLKELFQTLEEQLNKSEKDDAQVDGEGAGEGSSAEPSSEVTLVATPIDFGDGEACTNLLGLENDFLGLQLDSPAPSQTQQHNVDLDTLLTDDVFQAPAKAVSPPPPKPIQPPSYHSYKANIQPHQQTPLSAPLFGGSENHFYPQSNPIFAQPSFPMNQANQLLPGMQPQNGWTSFDATHGPLSGAGTYYSSGLSSSAFVGLHQQPPAAQPNSFTGVAPQLNPIDPFADLSFLSNLPSQPVKKGVTKDDFIKEPPKPTLLDLAGQKKDPFGFPVNCTQQILPSNSYNQPLQNTNPFASSTNPFE